ncbi:MAG TPA: alpha/beta hydrolase [Aeromicrobium sp.]|nr:alpha/beta hydrolase [Aeromicrobium sp.]
MATDLPTWFVEALAAPCDERRTDVDGVQIAYRAWGRPGDPVAVLIHGGAAHSRWWDHVGPHLADHHRIVSIDLSGHGDSDHRNERYTLEAWAAEVMAVAAAESDEPPVLFGHSMGGFVALTAARDHGERLRAVAAIDSPVRETSAEAKAWMAGNTTIPQHKVYPDRDTIIGRFRTLPKDDANVDFVHRHIAETSIRATADGSGWTWKFDPRIFFSTRMEPEALAGAACDVALIRGERGMATGDITDDIRSRLGKDVPVILIPDTGHHIMLDQPIAMIAVLQTLLSQWRTP